MKHSTSEGVRFVQQAVKKLPALWNSKTNNNSGLRAVFRRWNPTEPPSITMQRHVWELVFRDNEKLLADWSPGDIASDDLSQLVVQTSIIVALRAASGDQDKPGTQDQNTTADSENTSEQTAVSAEEDSTGSKKSDKTLGHALFHAEYSDLRMMRLLTTPLEMRQRELHRAMRYLNRKGAHIDWSFNETKRFLQFLFGTEEQAEWSVERWARDFFAARARQSVTDEKETNTVED